MALVRQAARGLCRRPFYAAAVVATVAVGVAASTTVFSVVDAVLLRPLPLPSAHELVALWQRGSAVPAPSLLSPANALDWKRTAQSFVGFGMWAPDYFAVASTQSGERVQGALVSGDLFTTLGVSAAQGRTLSVDDERSADRVVLSHALWQRVFGGDRSLVGREVTVNNRRATVLGILPATFRFPRMAVGATAFSPELFVPLDTRAPAMAERGAQFLGAIGRLRPGVRPEAAQREAAIIAARLERTHPSVNAGRGALVVPLQEQVVGSVRRPLLLVLAAAALLLLIACVNVANMLVARAAGRTSEIVVRTALGAGRSHLLSQFLAESLVIFGAGGAVAVALVAVAQRVIVLAAPAVFPRLSEVTIDARVLAFGVCVSLFSGLVFGALPVLHATAGDAAALRHVSRPGLTPRPGARRARHALVLVEIAVALVLLVGTALMVRTLTNLRGVDLGFEPSRATTFEVSLPATKYQRQEAPAVLDRLLGVVRGVPGVAQVGAINVLPLGDGGFTWTFEIENRPWNGAAPRVDYRVVTPGLFEALRLPLKSGRLISGGDGGTAPAVALVNESMVRQYWPGASPIGHRIRIQGPPTDWFRWATIVGVVGDVRDASVDEPAAPAIYRPLAQHPFASLGIVMRAEAGAPPLASVIRARLRDVDPDVVAYDLRPFGELVSRSHALRDSVTVIVAIFAAAAVFLLSVGIFGVVATDVVQRFSEIGIRMALGATGRRVVWTLMRDGALVVAGGVGLGSLLTVGAMPALAGLLYEVPPTDALAFGGAAGLLVLVSLTAIYLPARLVSRVDPVRALRYH
jgi:predicted permease